MRSTFLPATRNRPTGNPLPASPPPVSNLLMGNFDFTIFMHACYVAFVYSLVAWGATFYRQFLDDLDVKETVRLGEDMYFAYDPLGILLILVLCGFFCTFAVLALYVFPLEVRYYVIPLVFLVNIVQLGYRYHRQRFVVKTYGLVGKNIYLERRFRVVPYRAIKRVEFLREPLWDVLILHFYESDSRGNLVEMHRRFSRKMLRRVLHTIEAHTGLRATERMAKKTVQKDTAGEPRDYL